MKFVSSMRARTLCSAGLMLAVIGLSLDWDLAIVLGITIWVCLIHAPILGFASSVDREIWNLRMDLGSRKEQVPDLVQGIASRMGVSPPRRMHIQPSNRINASIGGDELYITEALEAKLATPIGEGAIAHEMAHRLVNHSRKRGFVCIVAIFAALVISFPLIMAASGGTLDHIWLIVMVCVLLTTCSNVLPLVSRCQEYEADRLAANVVGTETMIRTLKSVGGRWSTWQADTETHPSISKRIARLHGLDS